MCLRSESLDVELKIDSDEVPGWWTLEWVCVVVSPGCCLRLMNHRAVQLKQIICYMLA